MIVLTIHVIATCICVMIITTVLLQPSIIIFTIYSSSKRHYVSWEADSVKLVSEAKKYKLIHNKQRKIRVKLHQAMEAPVDCSPTAICVSFVSPYKHQVCYRSFRLGTCMEIGSIFPWDFHGNPMGMEIQICKMKIGRVHVRRGMGKVTFSCVPKFPSVDSMRMESNKML